MYYFLAIIIIFAGMVEKGQCETAAPTANAQVPLAVVNKARIKAEAKAFKSVHRQIEELRESFYHEVLPLENALRKQHQEIQHLEAAQEKKPQKKLAAILLKRKQGFEKRRNELEQLVQKRKQQLDERFQQAYAHIENTFKGIISEILKERSLVLILNAESVVNENAPDITDEVIQRLDNRLPEVQVLPV